MEIGQGRGSGSESGGGQLLIGGYMHLTGFAETPQILSHTVNE